MSQEWIANYRQANIVSVFIRSSIYWLFLAVTTILWAWPVLFSVVFPVTTRFKVMRVWPKMNLYALRIICGISYRVEGEENLPDRPAIVFSKHSSTLETLLLQLHIPPAVYVAKKELLYIPFFGWGMAVLNFITIDRSAGHRAMVYMVQQAKDRLTRGLWVIIFPEGTRMAIDAAPDYKIGGAMMAAKTGAPVVPVAHNAGIFWPRKSFLKWPGEATIWFGPAIETDGVKARAILDQAQEVIEGKMKELYR